MNKQELVNRIAELNDVESKAAASRIIESFIEIVTEEVSNGNEVVISGLGKFYPQLQAGRTGKVPGTDKEYCTADKQVPKFRAGSQFKQAVAK